METIGVLLGLVGSIPPSFWGVLVGAAVSILTVRLTNNAHDRRLRIQLDHDRDAKNRDRDLALRKEIYLAAAEAFSAGVECIGRYANLNLADDQVTSPYAERAPAIAKVHVVANEATARAVQAVLVQISGAQLRLMAKRAPLMRAKLALAALDAHIASLHGEQEALIGMMKQFNLEGAKDPQRWAAIQQMIVSVTGRLKEAIDSRRKDERNLFAGQIAFWKDCIDEATLLSKVIVPATLAVREELGIPIDGDKYRALFEEGTEQQMEQVSSYVRNIQAALEAEKFEPVPEDSNKR